jgi:hypothetical protein
MSRRRPVRMADEEKRIRTSAALPDEESEAEWAEPEEAQTEGRISRARLVMAILFLAAVVLLSDWLLGLLLGHKAR